MALKRAVLVAGLGKGGPRSLSEEEVKQMLEPSIKKMSEGGFDTEVVLVDVHPNPDKLAVFRSYLARKDWDCVSIGFGIRGDASHTDLFEDLVNACLEVPKPPKMSFCLGPDKIYESVSRVFGVRT